MKIFLNFLEASLSAIKQTASFKKNQIQNFEELIPYLEVTVYQKYLVRRLRGLKNYYNYDLFFSEKKKHKLT